MYHIILFMPILGLAVFWMWPLSVALPIYMAILALSFTMYFVLLKAMHRPITTGQQGLIGEIGEIIDVHNHVGHVLLHGEIWKANIKGDYKKGDAAKVIGLKGLILQMDDVNRESEPGGIH